MYALGYKLSKWGAVEDIPAAFETSVSQFQSPEVRNNIFLFSQWYSSNGSRAQKGVASHTATRVPVWVAAALFVTTYAPVLWPGLSSLRSVKPPVSPTAAIRGVAYELGVLQGSLSAIRQGLRRLRRHGVFWLSTCLLCQLDGHLSDLQTAASGRHRVQPWTRTGISHCGAKTCAVCATSWEPCVPPLLSSVDATWSHSRRPGGRWTCWTPNWARDWITTSGSGGTESLMEEEWRVQFGLNSFPREDTT